MGSGFLLDRNRRSAVGLTPMVKVWIGEIVVVRAVAAPVRGITSRLGFAGGIVAIEEICQAGVIARSAAR